MRPIPRRESRTATTGVMAGKHTRKPDSGWPTIKPRESEDLSWQDRAACVGQDPELWQGEDGQGRHSRHREVEAITVCGSCPVKVECRDYAIAERIKVGTWGGLTAAQREAFRRAARGPRKVHRPHVARLTPEAVKAARCSFAAAELTVTQLTARLGMRSTSAVSNMLAGQTWPDAGGPVFRFDYSARRWVTTQQEASS